LKCQFGIGSIVVVYETAGAAQWQNKQEDAALKAQQHADDG
jgi:hypothetical protein